MGELPHRKAALHELPQMTFLECLVMRYKQGDTMRELADEIGLSHQTVRYYLRKSRGYRAMVNRVLLNRIEKAQASYAIARTTPNRKKLKHAVFTLRRMRPALFKIWATKRAPALPGARAFGLEYRADCPTCTARQSVFARQQAGSWLWDCSRCGAEGEAAAGIDRRKSASGGAEHQTGADTGERGKSASGYFH